jgi:transposase-like protein/ribosomal protein L37AE/L43A
MEDYPKTTIEFEQRFGTEEACLKYLAKIRWPDGFYCPRCGHKKAWIAKRGVYRCKNCDYQVSITAGTIFHGTRKPLQLWFHAIWYITSQKNGVSAMGLKQVLGLNRYETVWIWLHKLRRAMVRPGRDSLSGAVEIDEAYIGGQKTGKRGRGAAGKSLVLVAVEDKGEHFGRIRLHRIADASAESLMPAVQKSVEPGSTVRTDGWSGYAQLSSKGYKHIVVRKNADVGDNLLPLANRVVALLKKWLVGTHQGAVCSSHIDYYLDEFTFRFNRRTSRYRGKLFYRLIQQAVSIEPFIAKKIRGGKFTELNHYI